MYGVLDSNLYNISLTNYTN